MIRRVYAKHQISNPHYSPDGLSHRLFTPEEIARLQRVPESLVKNTSKQIAIEGLGQGVAYLQPVILSQLLAKHLTGISLDKGNAIPRTIAGGEINLGSPEISVSSRGDIEVSVPVTFTKKDQLSLFDYERKINAA